MENEYAVGKDIVEDNSVLDTLKIWSFHDSSDNLFMWIIERVSIELSGSEWQYK